MSLPGLRLDGYEPAVTYSIGSDETATDAVLAAFRNSDIELPEQEQTLFERIDDDGLNQLFARSSREVRLTTRLWDRPVVVTPETVVVYAERDSTR